MPTSLRQHIAGKAAYLRHIGCSTTPVVPKCSEGGARCKTSPIIVDQKGLFLGVYRKPHEYARVLVSHSLSIYLMSIGSSLGSSIGKPSRFLGPGRSPIFPPTNSPSPAFVVHRSDGWGPWQSFKQEIWPGMATWPTEMDMK